MGTNLVASELQVKWWALMPCLNGIPAPTSLGEGTCLFPGDPNAVWWVDIHNRHLLRAPLDAFEKSDIPSDVWALPEELGACRLLSVDGEIFKLEGTGGNSLWQITVATGEAAPRAMCEICRAVDEPDNNRFNDGQTGPDGLWYAGTMERSEQAATGRLLRFERDSTVSVIDPGPYFVTNGPAFSRDGTRLYHNDSARGLIFVFDRTPDGEWSRKRIFHRYAKGTGSPDGMCVLASDDLLVAVWGGSRLDRFAWSGEKIGEVPLPARYPTRPALSADEKYVFVSTATAPGGDVGPRGGEMLRALLSA